jgi:hypothetical protein
MFILWWDLHLGPCTVSNMLQDPQYWPSHHEGLSSSWCCQYGIRISPVYVFSVSVLLSSRTNILNGTTAPLRYGCYSEYCRSDWRYFIAQIGIVCTVSNGFSVILSNLMHCTAGIDNVSCSVVSLCQSLPAKQLTSNWCSFYISRLWMCM